MIAPSPVIVVAIAVVWPSVSCISLQNEPLLRQTSQQLAKELTTAATAAWGISTDPDRRWDHVIAAVKPAITKLKPNLDELVNKYHDVQRVVQEVVHQAVHNHRVMDVMSDGGELAPRSVGAITMGLLRLVTDAIKMSLTRY